MSTTSTDDPVFLSADWTDADQRAWATDVADLATRFRRECDVRDWKRGDLWAQRKIEAGYTLTDDEQAEWLYVRKCLEDAATAEIEAR